MDGSPYLDPQVAESYDRLAVPFQFAAPARDLVSMLDVPPGSTVLDVGTGSGAVAMHLRRAVGSNGFVAGIDPSVPMLRAARNRGVRAIAAARTPGLPFRDDVFDAVAASFVVPHVDDYAHALADMARVCKPGGRVGVTAWDGRPNPIAEAWREGVRTLGYGRQLARALHDAIRWGDWFSRPENLAGAIQGAGLPVVEIGTREYVVRVRASDYLTMKAASVEGVVLQRMLTPRTWRRLSNDLTETFRCRFGDVVEYCCAAHAVVGQKDGRKKTEDGKRSFSFFRPPPSVSLPT
jgi:SAM-dependent methyltransferase